MPDATHWFSVVVWLIWVKGISSREERRRGVLRGRSLIHQKKRTGRQFTEKRDDDASCERVEKRYRRREPN